MDLKVQGLTKVFGRLTAVDHLTFTLRGGQIWGFIGPNGAGKTTTLRMLATVEDPTEGDAWLDGCSIRHNADQVRRHIGFMPDFLGTYPHMLVREYIEFFSRAYGLKGEDRRRRVDQIVDFIELGPLLDKQVEDLSRGMKQRTSLARALLHDPPVLLLDEPAAGLDPQARRDLQELLRLLSREDKTIFISSHILAELEDLVDQVVIIDEGKMLYVGRPEERDADGVRRTTLTMRIVGDLTQAARVLLEQPAVKQVHSFEPDILQVEMTGESIEAAPLVASLVARKLIPYQIVPEGKMLERVFLKATQAGRGDGNARKD